MFSKRKIISCMKSGNYRPLGYENLRVVIGVADDEAEEFKEALESMCLEGTVVKNSSKEYFLASVDSRFRTGYLDCSPKDEFGFVRCDDLPDIYIGADEMGDALSGDKVIAFIDWESHDKKQRAGHIVRVIEHKNKIISGLLRDIGSEKYLLVPDDTKVFAEVLIDRKNAMSAHAGSRVIVEITGGSSGKWLSGRVTKVIGKASVLHSCVDGEICVHKIKTDFNSAVCDEAERLSAKITDKDLKKRVDLRSETIFTLENEDVDFRGGFSVKKTAEDGVELGIHIPDVTHYVKKGSAIDREAYDRGNEIRIPDRILPMLPLDIRNFLCSFMPHTDRLAFSVFINIDKNSEVRSISFRESIIRISAGLRSKDTDRWFRNDARRMMTAEKSNAEGGEENKPSTFYERFMPYLRIMDTLSEKFLNARRKNNAVGYDFPEYHIFKGALRDCGRTNRGKTYMIINELLIRTGMEVAKFAKAADLPFVFRVNDAPNTPRLMLFNEYIAPYGEKINVREDMSVDDARSEIAKLWATSKGANTENITASVISKSFMKEEYCSDGRCHFCNAFECYSSFTNPLAHYADLVNQRVIRSYIRKKQHRYHNYEIEMIAEHLNGCEEKAILFRSSVDRIYITQYMSKFAGKHYSGIITNICDFGMFAEIDGGVTGLIRFDCMTSDKFDYDEKTRTLQGRRSGITYKEGDCVDVVLVVSDIISRQIDFMLKSDATEENMNRLRKLRRKMRNERIEGRRKAFIDRKPLYDKYGNHIPKVHKKKKKRNEIVIIDSYDMNKKVYPKDREKFF